MILLLTLLSGAPEFSWNPADKSTGINLSTDLQTATGTTARDAVRGFNGRNTGKGYFEITTNGIFHILVGVSSQASPLSDLIGIDNSQSACYDTGGLLIAKSAATQVSVTNYTGQTISVAVDGPNHKMYVALNGIFLNSANPVSGTNGLDFITTAPVYPTAQFASTSGSVTINEGGSAFAYSLPPGYVPWA